MTDALIVRSETDQFMPVMSIEVATERYKTVVEYVSKLLNEGSDFGVIPGTGTKKVLLKPGAEKLCTLFGLSKRFQLVERIEDWIGTQYGEPFFNYIYRCGLYRGDAIIAESDGSCNSMETKYRWRKGERSCPECGLEGAVIKGKAEYGGGWLCFKKKGGCGEKFVDGDERIESQSVERIPNPDIADQVNTMQKMAQKRALIAATLLAVNASDFFTQDLEDFTELHAGENGAQGQPAPATPVAEAKPAPRRSSKQSQEETERTELIKAVTGAADVIRKLDKSFNLWNHVNETYSVQHGLADLGLEDLRALTQYMSKKIDTTKAPKDEPKEAEVVDDDIPF